jgi:predicted dehydrogenase
VQLENFAQNVLNDRQPPITVDDGVAALVVALAATQAQKSSQRVEIASIASAQSA